MRAGTVSRDELRKHVRDHPRCRSPQGCLSCDEIRFWIKTLMEQFGWPGSALSRALGFYDRPTMMGKLAGKWIYPGEQIRASRQIKRILSGELVPVVLKGSAHRQEAALADSPVPLQIPRRMAFDLKSGRLGWVPAVELPKPALPSWRDAIQNAPRWEPK